MQLPNHVCFDMCCLSTSPNMTVTLEQLEQLFAETVAINHKSKDRVAQQCKRQLARRSFDDIESFASGKMVQVVMGCHCRVSKAWDAVEGGQNGRCQSVVAIFSRRDETRVLELRSCWRYWRYVQKEVREQMLLRLEEMGDMSTKVISSAPTVSNSLVEEAEADQRRCTWMPLFLRHRECRRRTQ